MNPLEQWKEKKREEFQEEFCLVAGKGDERRSFGLSEDVDETGILAFLDTYAQELIGLVRESVVPKGEPRPTNSLEDIAYALRREEFLSERERNHIRNRDNGLYIRMVAWAAKEEQRAQIEANFDRLCGEVSKEKV